MDVRRFLDSSGTLVWTLTTNGYKYLTLNLIKHLERQKVSWRLLVVCADRASYRFFQTESIPCILYKQKQQQQETTSILLFGSKPFQDINRVKLDILHEFANNKDIHTCVYMDGDIVVFRDFLPDILERLAYSPLLFQCDDHEPDVCKGICTGFLAFRQGADQGCFALTDSLLWRETPEDQVYVSKVLEQKSIPFALLPRGLYPNGVFLKYVPKEAYILHYNHMVGNIKVVQMKATKQWIIPYL